MKRILSVTFAVILLFGIAACGGEKKPPEPAAYQGKKILDAVRELSTTYERKDLDDFMRLFAPGYQDREAFERSIRSVYRKYETIRFTVQGTKMLVMVPFRGNIKASFNWDAEWRTAGGDRLTDGGRATLVFDPGDFHVLTIEGRNPFLPKKKKGK